MIRVKLKISIFALIDSISLINQRTMTIQQLEYILAVDQFRHFAKAAEYCRVTQPTLSAMIQKLEDELGVKLFDRSMTPVCPTAIGKKVLEQAVRFFRKLSVSRRSSAKNSTPCRVHSDWQCYRRLHLIFCPVSFRN